MTQPPLVSASTARPVIGTRLRNLLRVVLALFGLLVINSAYLGTVTLNEWLRGEVLQDYFYQVMFLLHLVVGLLLLLPAIVFGALHMRNAWGRPNYRAVRAGLGLYVTVLLVLITGLALTRFDFFEIRDPALRPVLYWSHVIGPLAIIWLFVLHRLAGHGIRWRLAAGWAVAAVALVAVALFGHQLDTGPSDGAASAGMFAPSLVRTATGRTIPARSLMMDEYCKECHADVHDQWRHSAHRHSSFNNPAYGFSVRETREVSLRRDGTVRASRFCAGCHDPVPLFSGAFDDPEFGDHVDPLASAGLTCSACHAITAVNSPRGNADYTITEPQHYPFAYSDNGVLQWVNRQLVKAKPDFHKKTFLKPIHREPAFCGTCHKTHLPEELNGYKWLPGQNHQDSYHLSGVSGHGTRSFYYPDKAVHKCAQCHMPLVASSDFGAARFDDSGELKVHDHLFTGANTALPHLFNMPAAVNDKHRKFLDGALRVDIFGVKSGGGIDGPLHAPLRPAVPTLVPGERYLLETVVRTLKLGHAFTQGTADSNEIWLEVKLSSGERLLGRSGAQDTSGEVDPWSHFVNAYVLDRHGRRIDRRNAQDIFTALYNHQIPPGASDVVHYAFMVPHDAGPSLTVEVRLLYRKFDTAYMRHFQGEQFKGNDLPITVLASDSVTFPVGGEGDIELAAVPALDIAPWQRWNDYGIALLRKGGSGELRQAEQAFLQVEELGRVDGPLNLARVYLREGRLEEGAAALRRAANHTPPAPPWVLTWLTGLLDKQNGFLDAAIANFKRIVRTDFAEARRREFDFSQDYKLLAELGQTVLERAKQERGAQRAEARKTLLEEARGWFERVLTLDPENVAAHYNMALIQRLLGNSAAAEQHQALHERYRSDDNAAEAAVTAHRRSNPAADHAASAIVIYDLQRPGAYGLDAVATGALPAPAGEGQAAPALPAKAPVGHRPQQQASATRQK